MGIPQLDQGTILTRIRSEKYPGINCYGIIITASCDMAHKKVSKYYYLTAVDVKQWLTSDSAYQDIYKNQIQALYSQLENVSKEFINPDTLRSLSIDEARNTITQMVSDANKAKKIQDAYDAYSLFQHPHITIEERKKAVLESLNKHRVDGNKKGKSEEPAIQQLKDISLGKVIHYYYLPMRAYRNCANANWIGLIVDFQEIGFFYQRDLDRLESPGFDAYTLDPQNAERTGYDEEDCLRYNQLFCIDDTDCSAYGKSVEIEGTIKSPWREHMMQRFLFSFSRIGLEDMLDADYYYTVKNVNGWPFT